MDKAQLSLEEQSAQTPLGITGVPRFIVDLDESAETRWAPVVNQYQQELLGLRSKFRQDIAEMVGPAALKILDSLGASLSNFAYRFVKYGAEIKGIAKLSGLPLQEILVIQFMYEACAACTSIVSNGEGPDGQPCHIRTMDWEMPALKALTIEVEFYKDKKPLYICTTWPGYIGVLTGMKANAFSSSVNFRVTGDSYVTNLKNALGYCWPVGFLLRAVLEEESNYTTAVRYLANSELISPVYFTCCGLRPNEGCIVTRNRKNEENRFTLDGDISAVQTNIDHWSFEEYDDILYSIERREMAKEACLLMELPRTKEVMFNLLSQHPIWNDLTVSATWMCPWSGEYETRLPNAEYGFEPSPYAATFGGAHRVNCKSCKRTFNPDLNIHKQCSHVGKWHDEWSHCGVGCARIGFSKIGRAHWSCCHNVNYDSPCRKSGLHKLPN